MDTDCLVKIADFGLARSLSHMPKPTDSSQEPCLTDYVATRWYRAPEILLGCKRYTTGVDLWSLGCILGEMLSRRPLFPGNSTLEQVNFNWYLWKTPHPISALSWRSGHYVLKWLLHAVCGNCLWHKVQKKKYYLFEVIFITSFWLETNANQGDAYLELEKNTKFYIFCLVFFQLIVTCRVWNTLARVLKMNKF